MIPNNISFKMSVIRHYDAELAIINRLCLAILILTIFFAYIFPRVVYVLFFLLPLLLTILNITLHIRAHFGKTDIITFSSMSIEIGKETPEKIDYTDIQKIIVNYRGVKGDMASWIIKMSGCENTVKIITKDGKKITKNIFCIDEKWDYWKILSLEDFLKAKGVEVEMKGFSKSRVKEVTHWVKTVTRKMENGMPKT